MWKKAVVISTLALALNVGMLWAKKPLVESGCKKIDPSAQVQTKTQMQTATPPSAPRLKARDLQRVRIEEVEAQFIVLLEHHKDASHRIAVAQMMEQKQPGPNAKNQTGRENPKMRKPFFSEFLEPAWNDSLEAYLRQEHDTLSIWLNERLYRCSRVWDTTAQPQNHSYAKLALAAKKNKCNVRGIYNSYNGCDIGSSVNHNDSVYANTLLQAGQNGSGQSWVLIGGYHYGLKMRLNKHLKKTTKQAVNVLIWDKQLDPPEAVRPRINEFTAQFARKVDRPLINLDVEAGLYKILDRDYAKKYGIDYLLVVDEKADLPMPPVKERKADLPVPSVYAE
jgi:hypothetical protein